MLLEDHEGKSARSLARVKGEVDVLDLAVDCKDAQDTLLGHVEIKVMHEQLRETVGVLVPISIGWLLLADVVARVGKIERVFDHRDTYAVVEDLDRLGCTAHCWLLEWRGFFGFSLLRHLIHMDRFLAVKVVKVECLRSTSELRE